jgi:hypothetical protein
MTFPWNGSFFILSVLLDQISVSIAMVFLSHPNFKENASSITSVRWEKNSCIDMGKPNGNVIISPSLKLFLDIELRNFYQFGHHNEPTDGESQRLFP